MRPAPLLLALPLLAAAAPASAPVLLDLGRWEGTITAQIISFDGITLPQPQTVPGETMSSCLTLESDRDPARAILSGSMEDCRTSNVKAEASRLSFDAVCKVEGYSAPFAFNAVGAYDARRFDMTMKGTTTIEGHGVGMTATLTGRHAGRCTGTETEGE